MNIEQKISLLAADAAYDLTDSSEANPKAEEATESERIGAPSSSEKRKRASSLFKALQSNECIRDCAYCPLRSGRDARRATIEPEELANWYHRAYASGSASGLYLSSGVRESGVASMDAMLKTADLLRRDHEYEGFLHLKIMPGAQRSQIQEAMRLADQISLNLDVPTETAMSRVSSEKRLESDLMERWGWIRDLSAEFPLKSGMSSQFVVGAAEESDLELLARSAQLYQDYNVSRIHYAGFKPIFGAPLEHEAPTSDARLNRLRQADTLMRGYGIALSELAFSDRGRLWINADPKMALALNRPEEFPLEVNEASYEEMIRVPGIGPLTARRLLSRRSERKIKDPREVALCGGILKRAAPFLLLDGRAIGNLEQFLRLELRRMRDRPVRQLSLFDDIE